jgi:hypothetical protein
MPREPGAATVEQTTKGGAMSSGDVTEWVVLVSGYVLAIGLFYWLGGAGRAAEAIRRWGSASTTASRPKEER